MLLSAISTVLTPAFRLLLFCFTAFRSSVIVFPVSILSPGHPAHQPSLPMPVVADRFKRLNLHQAARKPFKILRPGQLAVQPRRTGFKRVLRSRNQIFHIQQHAKIPAECCAIFMRDAGKLLQAQARLPSDQPSPAAPIPAASAAIAAFSRCPALGVLLQKDAKNAFLRRAGELQVHHVQPMRGGHSLPLPLEFLPALTAIVSNAANQAASARPGPSHAKSAAI